MARVPLKNREDLLPEDQQIWDEVGGSRGGVAPNFQAIFNNPQARATLAHLGGYVRFGNSLMKDQVAGSADPRRGRATANTYGRCRCLGPSGTASATRPSRPFTSGLPLPP